MIYKCLSDDGTQEYEIAIGTFKMSDPRNCWSDKKFTALYNQFEDRFAILAQGVPATSEEDSSDEGWWRQSVAENVRFRVDAACGNVATSSYRFEIRYPHELSESDMETYVFDE
jgi:hypothetical protein